MKIEKANRTLHIYELSRLVHASPTQWEKKLRELEENKDRAYAYYQPAREAIVRLCVHPKMRDRIVTAMIARANRVPHGKGSDPVRDNVRAFECFETAFLSKIQRFAEHYLRTENRRGVSFEGVLLTGLPHFAATDEKGTRRYVFLYPSAWNSKDLSAYLELLSFIVESKFNEDASSLWCMNLRTGKTMNHKCSLKLRRRCGDAAHLYSRLTKSL